MAKFIGVVGQRTSIQKHGTQEGEDKKKNKNKNKNTNKKSRRRRRKRRMMEGMVEGKVEVVVSAMDDEDAAAGERRRLMVTLDDLKNKMAEFSRERDWDQFHSPRNLLLALVGEVGELSEIFQWRGEVPKGLPGWKEEEKEHLGEELSDVLLYLVRLSDVCGVDLGKAVSRKLELNALKYPAEQCKGSSNKHTHYSSTTASSRAK